MNEHIEIRLPQGNETEYRIISWNETVAYSSICSPNYRAVTLKRFASLSAAKRSLSALARARGLELNDSKTSARTPE